MSTPPAELGTATEGDVISRGEADCFGCYKRILIRTSRKARLASPDRLYCDGVEASFCDKPDCQQMADRLDDKYGKPERLQTEPKVAAR